MRSSHSSSTTTIVRVLFLVAILFLGTRLSEAGVHAATSSPLRSHHSFYHRPGHHAGSSFSTSTRPLPSWCHSRIQLPPPSGKEIDLRYGVEKRFVPTGPNPLHN